MFQLAEDRVYILRSMIISLTMIIALSIITYAIITWGADIGLPLDSITSRVILIILTGVHALFLIVFLGNLMEYYRREPGVITMLFIIVIELIYIYSIGLSNDNILFSGSIAAVLLALIYTLIAT